MYERITSFVAPDSRERADRQIFPEKELGNTHAHTNAHSLAQLRCHPERGARAHMHTHTHTHTYIHTYDLSAGYMPMH